MKVVCITDLRLPDASMASGNRLLHMMRMVCEQGVPVEILTHRVDEGCLAPFDVHGVKIRSFAQIRRNRLPKLLEYYFLTPLRMVRYIKKCKQGKMVLYSYGMAPVLKVFFYVASRILHCPLCQESSELPASVYQNSAKWKQLVETVVLQKLYDAKVVMTDNLYSYYKRFAKKDCKFIKIPMTVDWHEFASEARPNPFGYEYIAYTGAMNRIGGGVDMVVKAFAVIASEFENLHLVLIGKGSETTKKTLQELVPVHLRSRLIFLFSGQIPRADMPRYIKNAKILLSLPLPTVQQEGCFPTKLGEYLACGVPTVITKVGNPMRVLTDMENVRFVQPNDVNGTAGVLRDILLNYSMALEIARRGQAFAKKNFDYRNYGAQLTKWLQEVAS